MPLHHTENDHIVKTVRATVSHDSPAIVTLGTIPAGSYVLYSESYQETFFNGTSPTVEVGISTDQDLIFGTGHLMLDVGSGNVIDRSVKFAVLDSSNPLNIEAYYTANGATVGSVEIVVYYI